MLPFQFSARLRTRRRALHRWLGRVYGLAIVISGAGGLSLAVHSTAGPIASWGFGLLAVLWVGVTIQAIRLAMVGRIAEHRRWMIRSGALTFAAVTLRLYLPVLGGLMGFDLAYLIVSWACWVPNLILAEWVLRRERQRKAAAQAATA